MLDKILNLFPVQILRHLENAIVANLHKRTDYKPSPELRENYCYMRLEIKILPSVQNYCDWFVCDGRGVDILKYGCALTENGAITKALVWIDEFLADEEIDDELEEETDV